MKRKPIKITSKNISDINGRIKKFLKPNNIQLKHSMIVDGNRYRIDYILDDSYRCATVVPNDCAILVGYNSPITVYYEIGDRIRFGGSFIEFVQIREMGNERSTIITKLSKLKNITEEI